MKKIFRFATIGTGKIVRRFLEAAGKCAQLSYAAVYSRSQDTAEAFAREYGVTKCYTRLEDLAADPDIDGVYIASPNFLHCSQSIRMMNHGKHVLCEKPAASNSQELEQMLQAAKQNNVVFLEAMRPVFDPGFAAIAENLPKLGAIRRVTLQYCQYSSRYDNYKKGIIENAFRPEFSNGALMDIGVYCIHVLAKLFGMPQNLLAQGVFLENGIDGAGTILAGYPDMQAELIYSKITDSSLPSQIQGENANMLLHEVGDTKDLEIRYRDGRIEKITIEKEANNMFYEAEEWIRLMEDKDSGEIHHRYSIMEMKILDEARAQMGIRFPADRQANSV